MTTNRRNFMGGAALGVASGLAGTPTATAAPGALARYIVNPGPKKPFTGGKAVCSTQSAITTETVIKTLRAGGNAIDAAIAGCMVQAAIEPYQSNHTGTVSLLYFDAKTREFHQLDSQGTFPGGLAPFRGRAGGGSACIPGFMPGMKAMYEKFASKSWASLCEDAIRWTEEGHPVSSIEYGSYAQSLNSLSYYPESRRIFMPDGYLRPVGELFVMKDLAQTLRRVAAEGPDYMITGGWADRFVATANKMGWRIVKSHMTETPPRWITPLRFKHHDHEIVGLAPPQYQGVFCSAVLGILRHLGIRNVEPGSADHLFYMTHALRWALYHNGYIGDPVAADYAFETLMSDELHASIAKLIGGLRPKIDLTQHVKLTRAPSGSGGLPTGEEVAPREHPSTCELAIVDANGNWVQMTHTYQTGGIPGMTIDGVHMNGSSAQFSGISGDIDAKLVAGVRSRRGLGSTMVLRDGAPAFSLGTPGNVYFTIPQVLTYLLDFKMDPYSAVDAVRMEPLSELGMVTVEDRIGKETVDGLRRMGVGVQVVPGYQWEMGSFQMAYRDAQGRLSAITDPRRAGVADGIR
jgi:gamma-glutamyltranspeptidase/glutathione hydrolase